MISYFVIEYFKFGPLRVYSWGLFIALAFLVGLIFCLRAGKRFQIPSEKIIYLVIFVYLGAMVGSRLLYILQSPADFLAAPAKIFHISLGGMMAYGGIFGGMTAGLLYLRKLRNEWLFIDAITPVIALSLAIGRIGCLLNNDHIGVVTSLPWAIKWPSGTLRHPVALYLILFNLATFLFLLWYKKRAKAPGRVFAMFLLLYGAGRFLLDFTRDSLADPHVLALATSQWISLLVFVGTLTFLLTKKRNEIA